MLIIRKEQMETFDKFVLPAFEEEMIAHLKQFAPDHAETIGDKNVRLLIRSGIESAKQYGLTYRNPVRFYIELMFMFGSDFDTDPQYAWAGEILIDSTILDQVEKADRLYLKTRDYLKKVQGSDYEYEIAALRQVGKLRFDHLRMVKGNFESEITMLLKRLYPQKCEFIGDQAIRKLIQHGKEQVESFTISNTAGLPLLVGLMFAFGHGCTNDPQFSWITDTLNDKTTVDPSERVERLFSKMKAYLSQALTNMGKV